LKNATVTLRHESLLSTALERTVALTILLPPHYEAVSDARQYPVLYLHDGQDTERLALENTLNKLYAEQRLAPVIVVGVHANHDRIQEYGTAAQADYKGRGSRAGQHTAFLLDELMPMIERQYRARSGPDQTAVAGCSLGGLMALDLAWHHPAYFGAVGVFSGALWWRKRAYEDGYDDQNDRIMHGLIRQGTPRPGLRFWFQAGTDDEKEDRNGNGIIDAIDDTLDLLDELEAKGYHRDRDFRYLEVPGGQHNPDTWGRALPDFLTWAFGAL
jgi:enterochelin esterase-like enzyme